MYDEKTALRVKNFIEAQKHTTGQYAGKPFILQDWQWKDIISPLYGTLNQDGSRQYRTCLVMVARKNGKTTLAAVIALYHLFADGEKGGQIYSAATDRDQASLVFNEAASMVRQSPVLSRKCKIIDSQKRIVNYKNNSFYRAIAADAASAHGYNASCIIYDELHAAANRELYDVLSTSMGARRQPLLFIISTAGFDRNSILWEQYNYANKVLKGAVKDDTYLPVIYEADDKDDWQNEEVWYKANPALGTFRNIDEMRSSYTKAKENPPEINKFKRLYLNMWTSSETEWLPFADWKNSAGDVNPETLKKCKCYGGLDLSSSDDITALVLVFWQGEALKVLPFFFIPKDNIEKRVKKDNVPYDLWVSKGLIFATEGNVIDYNFVEEKIYEIAKIYDIEEIAVDPYNALMLNQKLSDSGLITAEVRQGMKSLSPPTKECERLILSGNLHHGNNEVLNWMFSNVMIISDLNDNRRVDKQKSKEKIDGIQALIMAVSRASLHIDNTKSIYDTRDILVF